MSSQPTDEMLARVAERAFAEVQPGMRLGLGTGRAAEAFIRRLGRAVAGGFDVSGVPTSERSEKLARELGIPLLDLESTDCLDVAFDGADEVAPDGSLTKGKGGAMLRERVVASLAARFVILVTGEKIVQRLGEACALPIEVVPFALPVARRRAAELGAEPIVREAEPGRPYRTDNGNAVLDLRPAAGAWVDPRAVDRRARAIPGVVDTGFFFDMTSLVLVGDAGEVRAISPASRP